MQLHKTMGSKTSLLVFFALFLALSSSTKALDIASLLNEHPCFQVMQKLLDKTQLTQEINSRKNLTLLAINNGAIHSIADKPVEILKKTLSTHVLLDYFDEAKIEQNIRPAEKPQQTSTLLQASGKGKGNKEGMVNIGIDGDGRIAFGSGVKGSNLNAKFVGQVVSKPSDISIIQVSEPIMAPAVGEKSKGEL